MIVDMSSIKRFLILIVILLATSRPEPALAHPGRTDSEGCHVCRTNCDKYGVPWNERHCHGGGSAPSPTPSVAENTSPTSPPQTDSAPPTSSPTPATQPEVTPTPTVSPTLKVTITPSPKPSKPTPVIKKNTPTPTPKVSKKTKDKLNELRSTTQPQKGTTWTDLIKTQTNKATLSPAKSTPTANTSSNQNQLSGLGLYSIVSVVDGDTIKVRVGNKFESVRLLGIDTPEIKDPRKQVQCFGLAASKKMGEMVSGKTVRLEDDKTQGDRDKYQRLLRYVFLTDGTNVNAEMVKQGYAFSYRQYPTKMLDELNRYERDARENNRGLWGSCQIEENGVTRSTSTEK